jgi:hypothetical protein
MDFRKYVGRYVKIDLINSNIYYKGLVLEDTTETCLELKDCNGKFISLKEDSILNIREVSNGY